MNMIDVRSHARFSYDHCCEDEPKRPGIFMHTHQWLELYYLVRGDVEYRVESNVYLPKPGDVMLMRAGELHTSIIRQGPYERYNLRFSPSLLKETLNDRLLRPFLNRPAGVHNHYCSDQIASDYIRACLLRLFDPCVSDSETRSMAYLIPILQEIYDVWVTLEPPQNRPHPSLPAEVISYINQNLATLRSPKEVADAFYLSQSQLYRSFREYTGTTLWNYVRTKQLITAKELLLNGEAPAKVATACGFDDYSTFYRAYKRQFGRSPQDDRPD